LDVVASLFIPSRENKNPLTSILSPQGRGSKKLPRPHGERAGVRGDTGERIKQKGDDMVLIPAVDALIFYLAFVFTGS
jgi:hypothetical protein